MKLDDKCVSNGTYACTVEGNDAFLGRGINSVVVDPNNANHIFVGSALGVRGLSHVIGNGGPSRLEPGANAPGLYESLFCACLLLAIDFPVTESVASRGARAG